jgi:hypothetical protein
VFDDVNEDFHGNTVEALALTKSWGFDNRPGLSLTATLWIAGDIATARHLRIHLECRNRPASVRSRFGECARAGEQAAHTIHRMVAAVMMAIIFWMDRLKVV